MKIQFLLISCLLFGTACNTSSLPEDKNELKSPSENNLRINSDNWFEKKFKEADTVLLVSHLSTEGVKLVDEKGKEVPLPLLIVNNRPNFKIFQEQRIITGKEVDTITKILSRPFLDKEIESYRCYEPHHTIFLLKNGNASYIDVCFHCHGFTTSEDLKQIEYFDNQKWDELISFFRNMGFKYEMP